jgi:PTS system mannose-specific IIB component
VVDDHVASDFFRETVIKMAVPRDIEVIISSVEDFIHHFTYQRGKGRKTIVLFSGMADAIRAFRGGFVFDRLNIGNVYCDDCLKQCSPSVMLGEEDVTIIRSLLDEGVLIDVRCVPREKQVNIREMLTMIGA